MKARRCWKSSTTSRPAPSSTSRAGWSASPASPTTSAPCAPPAATSSSTTCSTTWKRPFQDGQAPGIVSNSNGGVVIQAVKDVTASGALYFSSAGNSGNFNDGTAGAWEGDFADGGPTAGALSAGRLHDFGGQNFNLLRAANTDAPISLYWSDPLGGSANDYDLFRLNAGRDCRNGELDQHPERHAGSDRAGQPEPGQPAHCHRQEDGRAAPLPSSGDQPRASCSSRLRA